MCANIKFYFESHSQCGPRLALIATFIVGVVVVVMLTYMNCNVSCYHFAVEKNRMAMHGSFGYNIHTIIIDLKIHGKVCFAAILSWPWSSEGR